MNYFISKITDNKIIVTALNFYNPLNYRIELENELKTLAFSGEIIFDLLHCCGASSNRFIQTMFENDKLAIDSAKTITPNNGLTNIVNSIQDNCSINHESSVV